MLRRRLGLSCWPLNRRRRCSPQRIKELEIIVSKTRKDLARVDKLLRLTPTKPQLKKQKGAIEKVIFLAQVEIAKLRKRARR
jgi:hypothetical protein